MAFLLKVDRIFVRQDLAFTFLLGASVWSPCYVGAILGTVKKTDKTIRHPDADMEVGEMDSKQGEEVTHGACPVRSHRGK